MEGKGKREEGYGEIAGKQSQWWNNDVEYED